MQIINISNNVELVLFFDSHFLPKTGKTGREFKKLYNSLGQGYVNG